MRKIHYGRVDELVCECGSDEIYPYEGFLICKACGLSHGIHYIAPATGDTVVLERDIGGEPRGTYIGHLKRQLKKKRK